MVKLRKHRKSRKAQGYSHLRNADLIDSLSGFSVTGLFRRPAEAAAVPKHVVVEDPHTPFIPGSFPFPKVAGMSVMTGDTGASGTTGMLALEASRVSVAVLDT